MAIPSNWLENADYPKCIVAIFDYYTEQINTMYLSTHKKTAIYSSNEVCFNPRLYGDIVFKTGLTDSQEGVRTTSSIGNLKVLNSDGALDNWLDLGLDGRNIKLYVLPLQSTNIDTEGKLLFEGTIDKLEISDNNTLSIVFRDPVILLDLPIQDILYTENEVINYTIASIPKSVTVSIDIKDKPKPIVYGKVFNIEPVLLSAASKVYQVDSENIEAILGVYDKGVALTYGTGYNVDLTKGIIEIVNNTSGTITCDVLGRKINAGAYSASVSLIVKDILINKGVNLSNINLDNAINMPVGIYISERENTLDILDKLVSSFDGFFGFDPVGVFRLGCLTIPNTSAPLHNIVPIASKYGDVITDGNAEYMLGSDLIGTVDYSNISTISNSGLVTRFNTPYELDESDVLGDITISSTNNITYRTKIKHTRNYTVQTDIASSVIDVRKEFIGKELREYALDNLAIKTKHIRAIEKEPYDTLLLDESSAAIIANRFIKKNNRYVYELKIRAAAYKLVDATIGSIIRLKDYRYGFDTGVLCTVRDIEINYLYGYVELTALFSRVPNQEGTFDYGLIDTIVSPSTTLTIPATHDRGRRCFSLDKVIGTYSYTYIILESLTPHYLDPVVRVHQVIPGWFNVSVNGSAVFLLSSTYDLVFLVDFDAKVLALYSNGTLHSYYAIPDTGYRRIKVVNQDIADDSTIKFNTPSLPISDYLPWGIIETKKVFNYEV